MNEVFFFMDEIYHIDGNLLLKWGCCYINEANLLGLKWLINVNCVGHGWKLPHASYWPYG